MEMEKARNVLQGIAYNENAGLIICSSCKHGMDSVKSLRSHLSISKHSAARNVKLTVGAVRSVLLRGTEYERYLQHDISFLPHCLGGSPVTSEQMRYRNAHLHTDNHYKPIQGLAVHWGYKCVNCTSFCCKDRVTALQHLVKHHGFLDNEAMDELHTQSRIPIQSLGQGRKEFFFPVHFSSVAEIGSLPQPHKGDTQAERDIAERSGERYSFAFSKSSHDTTGREANTGMSPFKEACQKSLPGSMDRTSHAKHLPTQAPQLFFTSQHDAPDGSLMHFENIDGIDPYGALFPEQPLPSLNDISTDINLRDNLSSLQGIEEVEMMEWQGVETEKVTDQDIEGLEEQSLRNIAEASNRFSDGEDKLIRDGDGDGDKDGDPHPNPNPNPNPNSNSNLTPNSNTNLNHGHNPHSNDDEDGDGNGCNIDDYVEKVGEYLMDPGARATRDAQADQFISDSTHAAGESVNVAIGNVPPRPSLRNASSRQKGADLALVNTEKTPLRKGPIYPSDVRVAADMNSFNIALERMHDSLNPTAVLQTDHENDYYDVPLNELPEDMDKNDSTMLKRCGFPGILVRMGFLTLGSVPTVLTQLWAN